MEDVGLVHLATPMKLDLAPGRVREIRAAGTLSCASLDSPGVVYCWGFVRAEW